MVRASLLLVAAGLLEPLAHAARESGSYQNRLTKCVHHCEAANACHGSLESFSCEATCQTVCQCKMRFRHMLNKPKHCTATMLAEQEKKLKQLSLLRKSKAKLTKVTLPDDADSENRFDSYVPLEDFFGKEGGDDKPAKPRMLNAKHLSMLKTAEPWSQERRHLKPHKKVHPASMAQVEKFLNEVADVNTTETKHPKATTTTTTTTTSTAKSATTTKVHTSSAALAQKKIAEAPAKSHAAPEVAKVQKKPEVPAKHAAPESHAAPEVAKAQKKPEVPAKHAAPASHVAPEVAKAQKKPEAVKPAKK